MVFGPMASYSGTVDPQDNSCHTVETNAHSRAEKQPSSMGPWPTLAQTVPGHLQLSVQAQSHVFLTSSALAVREATKLAAQETTFTVGY